MKIEVGRLYKTRTGKQVKIYAINCAEYENTGIHGAVSTIENYYWSATWDSEGYFHGNNAKNNDNDIVSYWEIPKSVTVDRGTYFLNFYTNGIYLKNINFYAASQWDELLAEKSNWVKVSERGYFEGTSMEDVRFVPKVNVTNNVIISSDNEIKSRIGYINSSDINTLWNIDLTSYESWSGKYTTPVSDQTNHGSKFREIFEPGYDKFQREYLCENPSLQVKFTPIATMCNCGGKIDTHKPECPENKTEDLQDLSSFYYLDESPKRYVGMYEPKKCECGSDSLGSPKHSEYCPKFKAD